MRSSVAPAGISSDGRSAAPGTGAGAGSPDLMNIAKTPAPTIPITAARNTITMHPRSVFVGRASAIEPPCGTLRRERPDGVGRGALEHPHPLPELVDLGPDRGARRG